jgi:hypothetical protein
MDQTFIRFKTLSYRGYILLFTALFGYTTFGYKIPYVHNGVVISVDKGLFYVWLITALASWIFIGIKNSEIPNKQLKLAVSIADILVTVTLLTLIIVLPSWLGLVRGLIVAVVAGIYTSQYFNLLNKGKLV